MLVPLWTGAASRQPSANLLDDRLARVSEPGARDHPAC